MIGRISASAAPSAVRLPGLLTDGDRGMPGFRGPYIRLLRSSKGSLYIRIISLSLSFQLHQPLQCNIGNSKMAQYGFSTEGSAMVSDFSSQVKDKIFLITGPSEGGIGAETAISLAHGSPSTVLLLGRSLPKIQPTIDAIHNINPAIVTKFVTINLDSLSSVRKAATTILSDPEIPHIDVMINNAAIMFCPYGVTEDGYELQFATNYLSHFLLTNILIPKILLGASKRIVNVSSSAHNRSSIRFDDIGFSKGEKYDAWGAYGQAKTANILFSVALNQRLGEKGVKSFALHPGSIASGLQKYLTDEMRAAALKQLQAAGHEMPTRKTMQQGCSTTLRAALDPDLETDESVYLVDCQIVEVGKDLKAYALDDESARKLWETSEQMVEQNFAY
jgi:NAD(P)-dependent dehydrogenase (short-subunit alcohol dehydrogenase family)